MRSRSPHARGWSGPFLGGAALSLYLCSTAVGVPAAPSTQPIEPWVWHSAGVIGAVAVILLAAIVWNARLRQLVRARTAELQARNQALEAERAERLRTHAEAARLTQIFEATTDFVATCDRDGNLQMVNPAGLSMVGLTGQPLDGKRCADIVPPWALEKLRTEAFPSAIRHGLWTGEGALLSPHRGEVRVSQVVIAHRDHAGEVQFISTVARDITPLKTAEVALEESRQRLELINRIATGINAGAEVSAVIREVVGGLHALFPFVRVRYCTMTPGGAFVVDESVEPAGMPPLQGQAGDLATAPEYLAAMRRDEAVAVGDADRDPRLAGLATFLRNAQIRAMLVHEVRTEKMEGVLCFDAPQPREWTPHEVATISEVSDYLAVAIAGASRIQDRLHAQERLRASEERLRLIIENMPVLAFAISPLGRIVFWNKEAQRVTGYSAREIGEPKGLEMLLPDPVYRASVLTEWSSPPSKVRDFEWNITCKDGSVRTIAWSSIAEQCPIPGWMTWGIAVDITERKLAEEMVKQSEERYRLLFDSSPQPMWIYDTSTLRFIAVNSAAVRDYGYSRTEFATMRLTDIRWGEDAPMFLEAVRSAHARAHADSGMWKHRRKDGTLMEVQVTSHAVPFISENARLVLITDVTTRNKAMAALRESRALLEQAQAVAHVGSWVSGLGDDAEIIWSRETCRIFGVPEKDEQRMTVREFFRFVHPDDRQKVQDAVRQSVETGASYSVDHRIVRQDGSVRWVHEQAEMELDADARPVRMIGIVQDITERHRSDAWRAGQGKVLEQLTAGEPLETVLTTLVHAIEEQKTDLKCSILLLDDGGQRLRMGVAPNLPDEYNRAVDGYPIGPCNGSCGTAAFRRQRVIVSDILADPLWAEGRHLAVAHRLAACWSQPIFGTSGTLLGTFAMYYPSTREPTPREIELIESAAHLAGIAITRRRDEQRLQERAEELARSNAELERFAYVASHDLQEPLRMVTSFTQLLGQRYKGKLDRDADEFIGFAVEGAVRMQQLIEDLLAFSRVSSRPRVLSRVHAAAALARAQANLRMAIETSGATVRTNELPEVTADESQLALVFQNLIGNAIKFRAKDTPPIVEVKAAREDGKWRFEVSDNGIGIDPKYREKIFTMFQRLHPRSVYPGNGIGLAICKRILERHNGKIWVESQPGAGTTFYFTIPDTNPDAPTHASPAAAGEIP
ncbi:MAG TPA: PAS domain S-box protein [Phycisphaerales bacterium]|nr:PAS domain S-box protein [Phycisphaerales bacterium]